MLRQLSLVLTACALCFVLVVQTLAQNKSVASAGSEISDREKDGLIGPVRRVTVETAKITFKNGSPSEGARVVRAVTTYDPRGTKVDNLAYPVDGTTLPGKETYKYDDKGNIVEMELRGPDGAILSKEFYKYVFDELGNWKQMTTSLAVFEDGKLGDEPIEITYRTISYFYNQEIARLTAAANKTSSSSRTVANESRPPAAKTVKPTLKETASTLQPVANVETTAKPPAEAPRNTTGVDTTTGTTPLKTADVASNSPEERPVSAPTVKHVSEEALRKAALSLPEPNYPDAAQLARVQGRVPVEVLIDEQGNVTKAQAMSGLPLLNDAAEAAARSARFAPGRLSQERTQVTGTINYDFVLPSPKPSVDSTSESSTTAGTKTAPTNAAATTGEKVSPVTSGPSSSTTVPAITESGDSSATYYNVGVSYLDAGKAVEAAEAFNKAVFKDPENAQAYVKLGLAYMSLQKPKDAVAVFKMALKIKRDAMDAEAYFQMGLALTTLGKHGDALAALKQALYVSRAETIGAETSPSTRTPSAVELHYHLGLAYHNLGRFEDAIKELQQVIAQKPAMAEAYYGLAVCYISMGDRKAAEKQQKILESLNPGLAARISEALATNRNLPPGLSDGILGGRSRH